MSTSRKLFYNGIVVIVILGILELSLRASSLSFYQDNEYFSLNRDINFTSIYDKDKDLFWRLKRSISTNSELFSVIQYRTNSQGFRGPEFPDKSAKTRIVALGNSCTFGWGVAEESIYTAQLQTFSDDFEAINCGTPGFSSFQGKKLLAEIAPELQPDVLLIMFGWNDHWPAGHGITDKDQEFPSQIALDIQNSLSSLSIYKALRQVTLQLASSNTPQTRMDQLSGERRVPLMDFKINLQQMITYAQENNAIPILISPPIASLANYFPGSSVSAFHDLHYAYQRVIKEVAQVEKVTLVDLQPAFDLRSDLFDNAADDAIHFNAAGHSVVANQIANTIDSTSNDPTQVLSSQPR